jgi:hypothetical protein
VQENSKKKSCPEERKVPFKEFMKTKLIFGKKTATSRNRKLGEVGDFFIVYGRKYEFIQIKKLVLCQVADFYFKEEGFDTPDEFIAYWKDLHRKHYKGDQIVYFHRFVQK